jgi:hypothetical protein
MRRNAIVGAQSKTRCGLGEVNADSVGSAWTNGMFKAVFNQRQQQQRR